MRRVVAVLFLLVAFGAFLGPFIWMLLTIGVATGLGTGEVHFDGGPARLASQLTGASLAFLLHRYFDGPTDAVQTDQTPPRPHRAAS